VHAANVASVLEQFVRGGMRYGHAEVFLTWPCATGKLIDIDLRTGRFHQNKPPMGSSHLVILCALLAAGFSRPAAADEMRQDTGGDDWKMERLVTTDGKVHLGLVEAEDDANYHFLELVRRQGQPMFAVRRPYGKDEVQSLERLNSQERQELMARWQRFRRRARVQAGRFSSIKLTQQTSPAHEVTWHYHGDWFNLVSDGDENVTRQTVGHLEQVFAALSQVLPPRSARDGSRLTIYVFHSDEAYRRFAAMRGIVLQNDAFFAADENVIAVYSPLARIARESAQAQAEHEALVAKIDALRRDIPQRLQEEREKLVKAKRSEAEIRTYLSRLRAKLNQELDTLRKTTEQTARQNQRVLEKRTEACLTTLRHEAFHAYLENKVFPLRENQVPRWLHEGLAQVFAHGILEGDTLRVDAPDPELLRVLQNDLKTNPLPLERLFHAEAKDFLPTDAADRAKASRLYAYAWGMAWYLLFEDDEAWTMEDLARLVGPGEPKDPVQRFEAVAGMPLSQFEARWRNAMLKVKPAR